MANVTPKEITGAPGIDSSQVNNGCGLHKNFVHHDNVTILDVSGGAQTFYPITLPGPATLQKVYLSANEAFDATATFSIGKINGGTTTAGHFIDATATAATIAAGTVVSLPLANTAIAAGDTIVVGSAGGASAGTGWIVLVYTIDDEGY